MKGEKTVAKQLVTPLPERVCLYCLEGLIVLEAGGKELYHVRRSFLVILLQQPAHTVITKKTGAQYGRNMLFPHPL